MKRGNILGLIAILYGVSGMVLEECRGDVFIYYDKASSPCYSAEFEYYRYTIRFDPGDFGVSGGFSITKIFASADIQQSASVPLIISDVSPRDFPDSICYQNDISFSSARWDTFTISPPVELSSPFWVSFVYTSPFIPLSLSDPEDYDPDRNGVETPLGWGTVSCDMAVGVVAERALGFEEGVSRIPVGFSLEQNYPNPFNPSTTLSFTTAKRERAVLTIYDIRGKRVETLLDRIVSPGRHSVFWQGDKTLSSGLYLYQLQVGEVVLRRKMFLSK